MSACHMLQYLPHDAMLARYILSLRVRLSVRTYGVRPSVTKMAKCRPTVVKCGQQVIIIFLLIQSSHNARQHRLGLRLSRTTAVHKLGLGCHLHMLSRVDDDGHLLIGPILWDHSGPLCHALALLSWTSIHRRRATVATPGEWQCGVRRLTVANGPNIFQMLLVTLSIHFYVQHDGRLGMMQRRVVHQR